ncbi:MAG: AAA family ATPase [Clostridiales bacterium]|jgi:lon-related putative ATP-dependent protease|nr:AAA family ATPase [Clostridiales bacterium]
MRELKYNELNNFFDVRKINFKTINDFDCPHEMKDQKKARNALEFGLRSKNNGFNIFVTGLSGTNKISLVKEIAEKIAKNEKIPDDLCYVFNFVNELEPKKIFLKSGNGKIFKNEIKSLICDLINILKKTFNNKFYLQKVEELKKNSQAKRDKLVEKLRSEALKKNFSLKTRDNGIIFFPILDNKILTEDDFENLDKIEKENIKKESLIMQDKANDLILKLNSYDKDFEKDIEKFEYNTALTEINKLFSQLFDKYNLNKDIKNYLIDLKEDIIKNRKKILEKEKNNLEDIDQNQNPILIAQTNLESKKFFDRYKVNLLVDNSKLTCAPVIVNFSPDYFNLLGEIEFENEFGNLVTDFMKIKPGLFHMANGGYLILQARDIFKNNLTWEAIRKFLKSEEIIIEQPRDASHGFVLSSLKPEKIKANVKIIIIGDEIYYNIINKVDEDFKHMFRIIACFDYEQDLCDESLENTLTYIKKFITEKKIKNLDRDAICSLIEYSCRIAESNKKLTTRYNLIGELISEANSWAEFDNSKIIKKNYILKALEEKKSRLDLYDNKLSEMIEKNNIMIDTDGMKIGQINGLAIMDMGDYIFAKPTRITATTYVGESGVINIEHESDMSGSIHDKGVQVLIGYLGQTYAQNFPLSLSCRVCFEQNYSGIDGDSASSSELYAIISSLSNLPIRQDIAVTGSINQFGEIQSIGGVTYKIEGFFDLCEKRGLTGQQGVIIPEQNIENLVLDKKVTDAIKKDKFHIYAINNINDGIEILVNKNFSKIKNEKYITSKKVNSLVSKKLEILYKKINSKK